MIVKPKYLFILAINTLIFSILIIIFSRLNVNTIQILNSFKEVSIGMIISVFFIRLLTQFVYAVRTSIILKTKISDSFFITFTGNVVNNVLPVFRSGDVARIFFSRRIFSISYKKAISSVILEHIIDLIFLGLILLIVFSNVNFYLSKYSIPGRSNNLLYYSFIVLFSVLIVSLVNTRFRLLIFTKISNFLSGIFIEFKHLDFSKIFMISINTAIIWFLTIIMIFCFFCTKYQDFTISDSSSLVLLTTFSMLIPSFTAGFGVFESGIVYYLVTFHSANIEEALAYAISLHFMILFSYLSILIIIFIKYRKKMKFTKQLISLNTIKKLTQIKGER